jgi:AraC-like DNA-binding protein
LNLRLNGSAVTRRLVALLGAPLDRSLEFTPKMDLDKGYGRSLAAHLFLAIADLERSGSVLHSPIALSAFEEFILTGLLVSHPHNYTGALRRREKPAGPRDVKRAIDYIEANLDSAIGLPEIVAASGVPGRTLIQHFRDFKGISPMRYLRNARLEKIHEALRHAKPEESITEIASNWGFTHMGRFSVEYRKRFGEVPSQTLRQVPGSGTPRVGSTRL